MRNWTCQDPLCIPFFCQRAPGYNSSKQRYAKKLRILVISRFGISAFLLSQIPVPFGNTTTSHYLIKCEGVSSLRSQNLEDVASSTRLRFLEHVSFSSSSFSVHIWRTSRLYPPTFLLCSPLCDPNSFMR